MQATSSVNHALDLTYVSVVLVLPLGVFLPPCQSMYSACDI